MSLTNKRPSQLLHSFKLIAIILVGTLTVLASGGGGSGESEPQPLAYIGNTDPAIITLDNAPILVANILFGGSSSSNIPTALSIPTTSSRSAGAITVVGNMQSIIQRSLVNLYASNLFISNEVTGFDVDEPIYCDSGFAFLTGPLDDITGTGTLSFTYDNCTLDGVTYDGSGLFRVDFFDWGYLYPTDATMTFNLLTMTSPDFDGAISGTIRMETLFASHTIRMTTDYVAKDNLSDKMYKFENFIVTSVYDNIFTPSSASMTFTGSPARAYDSIHGYIDVDTPTPLSFSSIDLVYPDDDGILIFYGANNSSIQLTVLSDIFVQLDLDIDGIPGYEITRTLLWTELALTATTDINDTDNDGMHDSWEIDYGLDPNLNDANEDPDGDSVINSLEYIGRTDPQDAASYVAYADLSLSQSSFNEVPNGAKKILHTSIITNTGPFPATEVVISYTIPAEFSLWSIPFVNGSTGSCSINTTITCAIPGILNSGDSAIIETFMDAVSIGQASITPVVSSAAPDAFLNNNSSTLTVTIVTPGPDIQSQIDAATSGDTIQVTPGIYLAPTTGLNFNGKDVHLESTNGPENTIIFANSDGYGPNNGVIIGPGGSIKGFTITNALGYGGSAIEQTGVGSVIMGNIFEHNGNLHDSMGFAIYSYGAVTIDRNIFRDNPCDLTGINNRLVNLLSGPSTVSNNIFMNNDCRVLDLNSGGSAQLAINNTFVGNTNAIVINAGIDESAETYRNNILLQNDIGIKNTTPGGTLTAIWDHNLVYDNTINYNDISDQTGINGNISVDPLFVNTAGGDYHLTTGSPAIDTGSDLDAPSIDFDGSPRPVDGDGDTTAVTDIGAFEFN